MFPKGHILTPMYWKSNCLQNIKYKCKQKGVVWGDIFNSFSSRRKSETYQYTFDWLSKCLVYKKYSFHLRSEIIRGQTLWVGQHGSLGRRHPGDKVWWRRVRRYWLLRFLQICMICFGVPVYYILLTCQVIPYICNTNILVFPQARPSGLVLHLGCEGPPRLLYLEKKEHSWRGGSTVVFM